MFGEVRAENDSFIATVKLMSKTRVSFSDLQADVSLMNERLTGVGSTFRLVANAGNKTRYLTVENTDPDAYVKMTVLCTGTAKKCVEQGWYWVSMHCCDALHVQNAKLITKLAAQGKIISDLEGEVLDLKWDIRQAEERDSVDY
jgi:hypothetical protein